jgi:glycosyltransferase involved in cell wall biosynthesis
MYSRIICVSEENRQAFIHELHRDPNKMCVIYNGVDLDRFSLSAVTADVRAELGWSQSTPIIGTISSLQEERKGTAYFLEMAGAIVKRYPHARFLVVGEGALRPTLQHQAASLRIADKVLFTGLRRDITNILAALNIFVLPSTFEGAPYAVLEAMAMAKPVVSTPVGNVAEIIADREAGMLVPIGDSSALAGAVGELLADDVLAERIGRRGFDAVRQRCSMDTMIDNVVAVYNEVS